MALRDDGDQLITTKSSAWSNSPPSLSHYRPKDCELFGRPSSQQWISACSSHARSCSNQSEHNVQHTFYVSWFRRCLRNMQHTYRTRNGHGRHRRGGYTLAPECCSNIFLSMWRVVSLTLPAPGVLQQKRGAAVAHTWCANISFNLRSFVHRTRDIRPKKVLVHLRAKRLQIIENTSYTTHWRVNVPNETHLRVLAGNPSLDGNDNEWEAAKKVER